ncbi:9890_t:CDS:2 [Funneliformis mosseae]|uniref:9890_t:CDS:1 n=1 Tax=Funneliformis mosseae TaxID=27381 RepID=A0A9N9H359_FUNMO|nr:9890_t:CDS:2 [Funneliformis mosseae]
MQECDLRESDSIFHTKVKVFASLNTTTRNNEKAIKKNVKRARSKKDAVITSNNEENAKRNKIKDSDIKGGSDTNISIDKYYPNIERIKNMYASLEQLCKICPMGSIA